MSTPVNATAVRACAAEFNNDPAVVAHGQAAKTLQAAEAAHRANPTADTMSRLEAAREHFAERSIGTVASQFALEECLQKAGVQMGVRTPGRRP